MLGSLEDYLHNNPPDYRFQVESLLELLYYAFTEYNITESPEFKEKIGPLDCKLRDDDEEQFRQFPAEQYPGCNEAG